MISKKNIVVYNPGRFTREVWLPILWAQAKTYYERNGQKINAWIWQTSLADTCGDDIEKTKLVLGHQKPDVFAVSLYVWNHTIAHEVARWVKQTWPRCLVVTGGPHQYFLHDDNWFRKHPYIDASLPGFCYGELCFQEILDNIDDDGKIDWNQVTDIYYPQGKSRMISRSHRAMTNSDKRLYDYDWAAMHEQKSCLKNFVDTAQKIHDKEFRIMAVLETTRGCPYGCTYCDWGGGINSRVIQKSVDSVKKDIDALMALRTNHLFFADANIGIFGDRDLEIIQHVAEKKLHRHQFTVGYGGFAKTQNKIGTIRDIFAMDVKYNLSAIGEMKISMQSLDPDVLANIDRKNVALDLQIKTFRQVSKKQLPIYVELIYGLPGMTLDKFYHELDILGEQKLSVQWFPWILLPEAPAYHKNYRQRHGISTLVKDKGWWINENLGAEIVVQTSSYTNEQYLEMLLASSFYTLMVQGGWCRNTVNQVLRQGIPIGTLIRDVLANCPDVSRQHQSLKHHWDTVIMQDRCHGCFVTIDGHDIYLGLYFVAMAFLNKHNFAGSVTKWIASRYHLSEDLVNRDLRYNLDLDKFGTTQGSILRRDCFTNRVFKKLDSLNDILTQHTQFQNSGNIMRGHTEYLGIKVQR
jgi:hypothetical protein